MAAGDIHIQAKYVSNMTKTSLASLWATNTIKFGIINSSTTPAVADSDPRWGAGGSQNYSTNEVAAAGAYSAGGATVAGCTSTLASATTSLNATSPFTACSANAANPTTARWGIFYDSTSAGKEVFGYYDFGGVTTLVPGYVINFNAIGSGTQPVFSGVAS